jgi:hypothetical protein
MPEENKPSLHSLFEEPTFQEQEIREVAGIVRPSIHQSNNGHVNKMEVPPDQEDEPRPMPKNWVGFGDLERLEQDDIDRFKTMAHRVDQLTAALGAMRGLLGLSLIVSIYAAWQVRKLSAQINGKSKGEVIEVEEISQTGIEDSGA